MKKDDLGRMKIEICNDDPLPIRQGRKSAIDYTIFGTNVVLKVIGTCYEKVRAKVNNIGTQAKILGYPVRTYIIKKDSGWTGHVTRKLP